MSVAAFETDPSGVHPGRDRLAEIERLRVRMQHMSGGMPGRPIPTLEGLGVQLAAGGSYAVDSVTLATALLAGASAAGEWGAVIGIADFGVEAAAQIGVALERTICVPAPGEIWLEATAALIDVVTVVVVRPPTAVTDAVASKVSARLRKRGAALVALGSWPRADARLSATSRWTGLGTGDGHLTGRQLRVEVRRGMAPPVTGQIWLGDPGRSGGEGVPGGRSGGEGVPGGRVPSAARCIETPGPRRLEAV